MGVGRWLERQRRPEGWEGPADGQRERLEAIGVAPLPQAGQEGPEKGREAAVGAFERGLAACPPERAL
ncbi:hypothetical protein [Streptomyces sp. NPDC003090]|uniref:hypothetical protein n=1 Tax=Streptomyces sp. NPDC003090 TaxID=3154274 RepID=UPI0038233315